MNTNRLLAKIFGHLTLLLLSTMLFYVILRDTENEPPVIFKLFAGAVVGSNIALLTNLYIKFRKQKHYYVLKNRFLAIKRIWTSQMWVLIKADKSNPKDLRMDIQLSDGLDMDSAANIVAIMHNSMPVVKMNHDANGAVNDILKDTNINPQDN